MTSLCALNILVKCGVPSTVVRECVSSPAMPYCCNMVSVPSKRQAQTHHLCMCRVFSVLCCRWRFCCLKKLSQSLDASCYHNHDVVNPREPLPGAVLRCPVFHVRCCKCISQCHHHTTPRRCVRPGCGIYGGAEGLDAGHSRGRGSDPTPEFSGHCDWCVSVWGSPVLMWSLSSALMKPHPR